MKKFMPVSLVAGIVLAVISAGPTSPVRAQSAGLVSSIVNRLDQNNRSLKSLRAKISMEKYNSQLREKETYQGMVLYIPGANKSAAFIRLEWTTPLNEILTVASGKYQLYRPRLKQVIEGTTGSMRDGKSNDVLSLMSMSSAQLRSRFGDFEDVREETLWGGVWTQHFKVTPKTAASYKYIEVWVDKEGFPVQTKMVEKNDDATTIRLSSLDKNQGISRDLFTQKFDDSVKRIKG